MSYGNQLNVFKGQAERHGDNWRGIVLCKTHEQAKLAMEDARAFLGGEVKHAGSYMRMPNGARLAFKVCATENEKIHALGGLAFTQIVWLHKPLQSLWEYAQSCLRSTTVPSCDWRHEIA